MLFPDVSLEDWCERYDLKVVYDRCTTCRRKISTTIPFAEKDFRGLVSPKCECGRELGMLSTQIVLNGKLSALKSIFGDSK